MSRPWFGAPDPLDPPPDDRRMSRVGRLVRLTVLNWSPAALLTAVVLALVILLGEPAPQDPGTPAWAAPTGHPRRVEALAIAPDGRRLATWGNEGAVVLWEVGRGVERELPGDPGRSVLCLAFAPDGATLAVGHRDATVRLWHAATGEERAVLRGHSEQVQCLAFSPDGRTLATGSADRSVRLWDLASGRTKSAPLDHPRPVSVVDFAPDGRTLASGCAGGQVTLWDLAEDRVRERPAGASNHRSPVRCLAFSPDGSLLASGGNDGIKLRDVATGRERAAVRTARDFIQAAVFAANGRALIVAMGGGIIQRWELDTGQEMASRFIHAESHRVALSPDGRFVASGARTPW
jgi:WD40 repeat protein